jgi:hypothetical protein
MLTFHLACGIHFKSNLGRRILEDILYYGYLTAEDDSYISFV